jgi:hypothetical protein
MLLLVYICKLKTKTFDFKIFIKILLLFTFSVLPSIGSNYNYPKRSVSTVKKYFKTVKIFNEIPQMLNKLVSHVLKNPESNFTTFQVL